MKPDHAVTITAAVTAAAVLGIMSTPCSRLGIHHGCHWTCPYAQRFVESKSAVNEHEIKHWLKNGIIFNPTDV